MRIQQKPEAVLAKIRISQAVWQRVAKRRAGHREGRGSSVLSRHRGTTKRRRVADWRCCHAETSNTSTQSSVRYHGAWPCKLWCYIGTT